MGFWVFQHREPGTAGSLHFPVPTFDYSPPPPPLRHTLSRKNDEKSGKNNSTNNSNNSIVILGLGNEIFLLGG